MAHMYSYSYYGRNFGEWSGRLQPLRVNNLAVENGKHQTKGFQTCVRIWISVVYYCIEKSQVGFTVDNFLPLRREIGLKPA